jgi:hypothetical protein
MPSPTSILFLRKAPDQAGADFRLIALKAALGSIRAGRKFVGLNGGADFYAKDTEGLRREGEALLKAFLRLCAEDGVSPKKPQRKFALRLDPETYSRPAFPSPRTASA